MDHSRPGHRELYGKVEAALNAVAKGKYLVGAADHIQNDLTEMKIESQQEFWALLPVLLEEIKAKVPGDCYRGRRPEPELSVEPMVKGLKLWAFVWESGNLGQKVYLKFCLKELKNGEIYYAHVRLHPNREP